MDSNWILQRLQEQQAYLEIPSVAGNPAAVTQAVAWISARFQSLGATQAVQWTEKGGNPVIFAEFAGNSARTVLFYNHYDVQPANLLSEWRSDPFKPKFTADYLIGRGVADDKGDLLSRLTVLEYWQNHGGLPVKVKFMVEGEEEIGSPHVASYVQAHQKELAADLCIWEGGNRDEADNFEIICGAKGVVSFQAQVQTAAQDLHSSLACYADNAAWRLLQALNSLRSTTGEIQVDGFFEGVQALTPAEEATVQAMEFDPITVRKNYGLWRPLMTKNPKEVLINGPTLNISALTAGDARASLKTVVPSQARALLDCRLVPGQDPHHVVQLVARQLERNGYGDVEIQYLQGEAAGRSDLNDPQIQLSYQIAQQIYGQQKVRIILNMAGGGPVTPFLKQLKLPLVMIGVRSAESKIHAPNENLRLQAYQQATVYLSTYLETLARL
ncbi:M20/M25/M40 family metallo-hydrolase [Lactobacillus sp. DCY120]|uniref:M20/M25/M40 family metallo-hydrolase n=1 Tax=Bombilactobacillus apium TaxID=2675299 RepID=A0A850QXW5_9LACO|nr:M20/M25/M40 family metallo-hydrolase [Bombilactobacillus apium]NVY96674.1 M20/M25/M40 family metallo-hydrolase [Bombilactobacillus apium]